MSEMVLEGALKVMWTEDALAAKGLPETSMHFFWGEGELGAVALHVRPKSIWILHEFKPDDFPDSEAEDRRAETRRVVKRADEIILKLKDEAKRA